MKYGRRDVGDAAGGRRDGIIKPEPTLKGRRAADQRVLRWNEAQFRIGN